MSSRERAMEQALKAAIVFMDEVMEDWSTLDDADLQADRQMVADCQAALAAPGLGWTREKPNLTGYYWWRTKAGTASFIVFIYFTKHWMVDWGENESPLHSETDGEWAGPLEVPT